MSIMLIIFSIALSIGVGLLIGVVIVLSWKRASGSSAKERYSICSGYYAKKGGGSI